MVWLFRGICSALIAWMVIALMWQAPSFKQDPAGCDRFGYQRQASLIRTEGLGGLDTSLTLAPLPQILEAAKQTEAPVKEWSEAVAPHCHHYVARTDKVILQYPVGTGALMAIFPEQSEERALWMWSAALSASAFFALIALNRQRTAFVPTSLAAFVILWTIASESASPSVWPAMATACAAAVATTAFYRRGNLGWGMFAALVIGLSVSIRLSNGLLILGPISISAYLWISSRRKSDLVPFMAISSSFVVGLVPLLLTNAINAGSVFATTYAAADAAPPVISQEQIAHAASFYLSNAPSGLLLTAAIVLCAFEGVRLRTLSLSWRAATIVMTVNVAFFFTKTIMEPYYLAPASAFVLTVLVANWSIPKSVAVGAAHAAWFVFTSGMLAVFVYFVCSQLPILVGNRNLDQPLADLLADRPVVWADVDGGYFVLLREAYSAKLLFAKPDIQAALVSNLFERKVPQLFVEENDSMREIVERLSSTWIFKRVGTAYGSDVVELVGHAQ